MEVKHYSSLVRGELDYISASATGVNGYQPGRVNEVYWRAAADGRSDLFVTDGYSTIQVYPSVSTSEAAQHARRLIRDGFDGWRSGCEVGLFDRPSAFAE